MKKLKTIQFMLLFLLTAGSILKVAGQATDKFIRVGDTTINLKDVDLEKGMVIKEEKYSLKNAKYKGAYGNFSFDIKLKLFTSYNCINYALVYDTTVYQGYGAGFNSRIRYYDYGGKLLFDKHVKGFGIYRCYVSSSGESIIIGLTDEDAAELVYLYDKNGKLIKKYNDQYGRFYKGSIHSYFLICNHSDYKGSNTYDYIDKSGNIKEVVFPDGFLRGIKFSPSENYYIVSLDDQQLLYDKNNSFIWKKPKNKGFIYFLKDKNNYLLTEPSTNFIKIKDLFTDQLKFEIRSVKYKGNEVPIYRSFKLNDDFYVIGKSDTLYIYNFYNSKGELLQTEAVPVLRKVKPYKVIKKDGKFIIKPRIKEQ